MEDQQSELQWMIQGHQTGGRTKAEEVAAYAPRPPVSPKVTAEKAAQLQELVNATI